MQARRGFTLVEMLAVMMLMVLIMGVALAGYNSMTEGAAIKSVVTSLRTEISAARSFAVGRSRVVTLGLSASNTMVYYVVGTFPTQYTTEVKQTKGEFFPPNVYLAYEGTTNAFTKTETILFYPDGSVSPDGAVRSDLSPGSFSNRVVDVCERGGRKGFRITVLSLTGGARVTDIYR